MWNYGIVKMKMVSGEVRYAIHEVYHLDDGISWTENPIAADVFYDKDEDEGARNAIRETLKAMLEACERPLVIDPDSG
jgi:hypothetical protein